jgi:uncharacterized membrane protein YfcA
MVFLALGLIALLVGTLIGSVGVGGILLIPALAALGGLTTQVSMSTALFSFIFTGVLGTWMYQRRGSIDWGITVPVCLGAVFFGYLGALANSLANAALLNFILSLIIIFAGVYTFLPGGRLSTFNLGGRSPGRIFVLLCIGAVVGFGSGLTGVGGPVLSVPFMVVLGFAPLTAIATSQVIQIVAALSGTIGNLAYGSIDFFVAGWVTVLELLGVMIGVRIAHSSNTRQLRILVAVVCVVVGGVILVRSSLALFGG